jgi:hypothetical protein
MKMETTIENIVTEETVTAETVTETTAETAEETIESVETSVLTDESGNIIEDEESSVSSDGLESESETTTTEETTTTTEVTTMTMTTAPVTTTTVPTTTVPITVTTPVTSAVTVVPADDYLFTIAGYGVTEDNVIFGGIAIMLIVAFLLNYRSKKKKKALESDTAPKSARERDAKRLSEMKQKKEKQKKKVKKAKKSGILDIMKPKRAYDRLPYKKILSGDIWLVDDDTYSRAYVFDDINYNMYDYEKRTLPSRIIAVSSIHLTIQ